jgi:hypothetical protein
MRYSRLVGWFKGWLAEAYLLRGDTARAATEAQLGLEISRTTGFTWAVGLAQRALGNIARARSDPAEAEWRLGEALRTFETIQSRFDAGRTQLALAELAGAQQDDDEAITRARQAQAAFVALNASQYVARVEQFLAGRS